MLGGNNGQTLSGLDASYTDFVRGTLFRIGDVAVYRNMCLYSVVLNRPYVGNLEQDESSEKICSP